MSAQKGRFSFVDNQGYVKSWRKLLDNVFLMHDNNAYIVFTKLLLLANHKNGQYITGRNKLAELTNINPRTLYDVLIRLENQQIINIASNNKYSVITICNWNTYQGTTTSEPNIQTTSRQQQPNIQTTHNKNEELRIKKQLSTNVLNSDEPIRYGNADVNEIFDYWQQVMGYEIKAKVKANRNAAASLIKSQKMDNVKRFITWVSMAHSERYAPKEVKAGDFVAMRSNLNEILAWARGKASNEQQAPRF